VSYYSGNPASRQSLELKSNRKLILSIDRLDYTKGLVNRALAIENLVRRYPDDARKFTYIMIVTPSRTSVTEYMNMKRDLEMTVGRINGSYSDLTWQPILYLYRRVTDRQLMNYYRSANVALIAPLIDGLNLVSKEFVAATRNGVLILSRFAGASFSLNEALKVNPYDLNEVADRLHYALHMTESEIRFRLESMKENVINKDINWWLSEILSTADMLERKLNGPGESVRNTQ
jgi:trehalose 6-phosphate synthase